MRVMTCGAFPLFHGRMDNLAGKFFVMAVIAELGHIRDGLEFMGGRRLVTIGAFPGGHRTMNVFFLAHVGVTFDRNTGCFFFRGSYPCSSAAVDKQKKQKHGNRKKGIKGQIFDSPRLHETSLDRFAFLPRGA